MKLGKNNNEVDVMRKLRLGVIGCGMISEIYLKNCKEVFRNIEVVACADILEEKAKARAETYGAKCLSVDKLLSDDSIDVILNLTIPAAHYEISKRALEMEKHVYSEKPLALTIKDGLDLVKLATSKGLKIGCAPDTFLGAGIQTAKKLIDDGWIGNPIAANAFFMARGPEAFHPAPEFFYQKGGGPLFDMGPYYITALVSLLGPVNSVMGMAKLTHQEKIITGAKRYGETFPVETPTHISALLDFDCAVTATMTTTFDMNYPYWESKLPFIEIYGSEGSVSIPDPNKFEGPVKLRRGGDFMEIPLVNTFVDNMRGMGLSDLADTVTNNRPVRADGKLALHVVEVMSGILDSSEKGVRYVMEHKCSKPETLPKGLPKYLF